MNIRKKYWIRTSESSALYKQRNIEILDFSQNKRDLNEITLAITLLAGLTAFLLKLVDYFNNHIIVVSPIFQLIVYFLVYFLLLEFLMIFLFLILKGYLVSTKYRSNMLKNISEGVFRGIFKLASLSVVFSFLIVLSYYFFKDVNDKYYYVYYIIGIIFIICFIWLSIHYFYRIDYRDVLKNIQKNIQKKYREKKSSEKYDFQDILFYYFVIIICILGFVLLLVASSYLLMGSFSIDQFPQSNTDNEILIFTIKETGMTYSANYIGIYKINSSDSTIFQNIDNFIINDKNENFSKIMFGKKHEGIWYLNINTSNLTSGTYLLHAEVTNDMTIKSIFGSIKKHDDKLFYVAPK